MPYTQAVHCAYVFDVGSRDDPSGQEGMAHFIEHTIFKGTKRRKTYHVLNYLESVGGELNAYTGKEKTCLYASVSASQVERAVDLLTDISFHATFPEQEIRKEKMVVSEEIDLYRNAPEEAIFEDFDRQTFGRHPLGHPILGYKEGVKVFQRQDITRFLQAHYGRERTVFALIGNVPEKNFMRLVDKYLRPQELATHPYRRKAPRRLKARQYTYREGHGQAHEIVGGRAPALRRNHFYPFILINNMLGGPAMNSRLNLKVREQYGLTYNISTFYSPYLDSGIWGVYYACDPTNLKRIRRLVHKELDTLCQKPLGSLRLHQMKKQFTGQLILGHENLMGQLLGVSKDLLDFGEVMPFATQLERLQTVTASQIQEAAQLIADATDLSRITYLPEEETSA